MAKKKSKEVIEISPEEMNKLKEMLMDKQALKSSIPTKLSVLPLRDIIIFPNMIFPILIGRTSSLRAVSEALDRDKFIFVSAQLNPMQEDLEL